MFKKIGLFILIQAFLFQIHAQDSDVPSNENMDEILRQVDEAIRSNPNLDQCPNCVDGVRPIEACRQKLCPDVVEGFADIRNDAFAASGISDVYLNEIFPLFDQLYQKEFSNQQKVLTQLRDWLPTAPNLTGSENTSVFNALPFIEQKAYRMEYNRNTEKMEFAFSTEDKINFTDTEYQQLQRRAAYVANIYNDIPFNKVFDSTHAGLLFSRDELRAEVQKSVAEIHEKVRWLRANSANKYLQFELSSQYWNQDQDSRFDQGILNPEALQSLAQDLLKIRVYTDIHRNPEAKSLFQSAQVDIRREFRQRGLQSALNDQIEDLGKYTDGQTRSLNDTTCASAYHSGQNYLPAESEIPQIRSRVQANKDAFIRNIRSQLSAESYSQLRPIMNSWEIALPQSRESHARQFRQAFQNYIAHENQRSQQIDQILASDQRDAFLSNQMQTLGNESAIQYVDMAAIRICSNLSVSLLSDAALIETKRISVSPLAISDPEASKSILAHEMGHQLYFELKSKKYSNETQGWLQSSMQCVSGNHKANGDNYLSEDWADFVAAKVALSSKNMACHLFGNYDLYNYTLEEESPVDPHSTGFFRLLNYEIQSGRQIPAECQRAISEKNERSQIKSCESPNNRANQ